jgi:hypothetical protein
MTDGPMNFIMPYSSLRGHYHADSARRQTRRLARLSDEMFPKCSYARRILGPLRRDESLFFLHLHGKRKHSVARPQ